MFFSFHRHRPVAALTGALAIAALGVAAMPAAAAAPTIRDVDAELRPNDRLHLSVETAGATKVTFKVAGRTAVGRLTDVDDEDGTRDYERTISARGMKPGTKSITVRACGADGCTNRTVKTFVERDDD